MGNDLSIPLGCDFCCPTTAPQPLVDENTAYMFEEAENAGIELRQHVYDLEHEIERLQLLPMGKSSPPGSHDRVIAALQKLDAGPVTNKAVQHMLNSQEIARYDSADGKYSRSVYSSLANDIEAARRTRDNLQVKYDAAARRIEDAKARIIETLQFRPNATDSPLYQDLEARLQSIDDVRRALANARTFDATRNPELFESTRFWLTRR